MDASLLKSVQSEQSQAGSSRDLAGNQTVQLSKYRSADKSLDRPGRKQARKHGGTCAISTTSRRELSSSFFFMQGKAPKEIHASLTETLDYFFPGQVNDLSESR